MLKHIQNPGRNPMYVGGTMIPPGESKHVEVPETAGPQPALQEDDAGKTLIAELQKILDQGVDKILPLLPNLTNEGLDLAEGQEAAGKNRKTLIAGIQAERMNRANAKLQADQQRQAEEALEEARKALLTARVALDNLAANASPEDRAAAQTDVDEAQARVDALTPAPVV
jgi:hypothetical protein